MVATVISASIFPTRPTTIHPKKATVGRPARPAFIDTRKRLAKSKSVIVRADGASAGTTAGGCFRMTLLSTLMSCGKKEFCKPNATLKRTVCDNLQEQVPLTIRTGKSWY